MKKRIILIGGSYGIGDEMARSLVEKGHNVTVMSRTAGKRANVDYLTYDANDMDSFPIVEGAVDGLAYLPGTINLKPFHRLTNDDFLEDLNTNLIGAVYCIRELLPNLKLSDGASIVLFSTVAVGTGMGFHASIAAAKGAVEGLTRSLAAEVAPKIRVNCVAPSLTETPLAERLLNSDQKKEAAAERHPLKRYGKATEIAAAAAFLLSDESSWMTGQIVRVDGGLGSVM